MNSESRNITCGPLDSEITDWERFIQEEIGICIPIGTLSSYRVEDQNSLNAITRYLLSHRPNLSKLKLDLSSSRNSDEIWAEILDRLCGEKQKCYLSGWLLLKRDLPNILQPEYKGEIITRGEDPEIPVLLEWSSTLLKSKGRGTPYSRSAFSHVWYYGSWGYIIPKESTQVLRKWANMLQVDEQLAREFFDQVTCFFWVKYELDGIWVLSHKLDWREICHKVQR